jgi:hypothetical protein
MGLFASPNSAGVMNSLPPDQRGAGAGMLATFMNTASVLSIGVFFTLMIVGLAADLPLTMQSGLVAHGVTAADAHRVSSLPPVATLFASFLGYNPMATLLGPQSLHALPPGQAQQITGRGFFPQLISEPFHTALVYAFVFAIVACLIAVIASLLRGGKYHHTDDQTPDDEAVDVEAVHVEAVHAEALDAAVVDAAGTGPAGSPTGTEPVEADMLSARPASRAVLRSRR